MSGEQKKHNADPGCCADEAAREAFLANDLVSLLRKQNDGTDVHREAQKLCAVVEAVKKYSKKGKLTLTISVEPMDEDDRTVQIGVAFNAVIPQQSSPKRMFFVTDSNGLSRNAPGQLDLFGHC